MNPSCPPVDEKTAGGPALVWLMKGEAWRGGEAEDIPFRTAEALRLPQPHPAALRAASCPSAANVLRTSVKGEAERKT